jgi:hypothetical protein
MMRIFVLIAVMIDVWSGIDAMVSGESSGIRWTAFILTVVLIVVGSGWLWVNPGRMR